MTQVGSEAKLQQRESNGQDSRMVRRPIEMVSNPTQSVPPLSVLCTLCMATLLLLFYMSLLEKEHVEVRVLYSPALSLYVAACSL